MISPATLLVALSGLTALGANAAPTSFANDLARRVFKIAGLESLGISEGCQNTLTGLLDSPASQCMNIPGTVAILSTVEGSSWIPPTNAWLSSFCAETDCTADQISATISIVADGCAAELATANITKETVISYATEYFVTAKSAVCLRDSSDSNALCAITTLENAEEVFGEPLTPSVVQNNYQTLLNNDFALARQLACTSCASAGFTIVRPMLPTEILDIVDSFVGDQCGVDFTSIPNDNVINVVTGTAAEAAAEATQSASSAPLNFQSGIFGSILAVLAAFTALA